MSLQVAAVPIFITTFWTVAFILGLSSLCFFLRAADFSWRKITTGRSTFTLFCFVFPFSHWYSNSPYPLSSYCFITFPYPPRHLQCLSWVFPQPYKQHFLSPVLKQSENTPLSLLGFAATFMSPVFSLLTFSFGTLPAWTIISSGHMLALTDICIDPSTASLIAFLRQRRLILIAWEKLKQWLMNFCFCQLNFGSHYFQHDKF